MMYTRVMAGFGILSCMIGYIKNPIKIAVAITKGFPEYRVEHHTGGDRGARQGIP
jgi:hypothetical protein